MSDRLGGLSHHLLPSWLESGIELALELWCSDIPMSCMESLFACWNLCLFLHLKARNTELCHLGHSLQAHKQGLPCGQQGLQVGQTPAPDSSMSAQHIALYTQAFISPLNLTSCGPWCLFLLHRVARDLGWALRPNLACHSCFLAENVVLCKKLLWANTWVKRIILFQKALNMVFHKAYYRALYLIIIYWGVIVHLVMEAKFIFFFSSPD